ncbi:hypothetical protein DXV65_26605 [Pseudomonas fluorescens]|nr:hypothetical protein DXV65_26605 [Pseudomonas fluorescens]
MVEASGSCDCLVAWSWLGPKNVSVRPSHFLCSTAIASAYFERTRSPLSQGFPYANRALIPNHSKPRLSKSACNLERRFPAHPSTTASTPM